MHTLARVAATGILAAVALLSPETAAQTTGQKEEFTAIAIANDDLGSGATNLIINIERWSTSDERAKFLNSLRTKAPEEVLNELGKIRPIGTIRTPGNLGYPLRFIEETRDQDGSRHILIISDRPFGFSETWYRTRSVDYPFTVIQMTFGADGGIGRGSLTDYAKITALGRFVEVENLTTSPIKLTQIRARKR